MSNNPKVYKTFRELYEARPCGDTPMLVYWPESDLFEYLILLDEGTVVACWPNENNYQLFKGHALNHWAQIDLVDYFDESAPTSASCTCPLVSLLQSGCQCGQMERERQAA